MKVFDGASNGVTAFVGNAAMVDDEMWVENADWRQTTASVDELVAVWKKEIAAVGIKVTWEAVCRAMGYCCNSAMGCCVLLRPLVANWSHDETSILSWGAG